MAKINTCVYMIPITVIIEAEDTDPLIRRVGETIHDSVSDLIAEPDFNDKVAYFDMQYSLHKKMLDEEVK